MFDIIPMVNLHDVGIYFGFFTLGITSSKEDFTVDALYVFVVGVGDVVVISL